MQNFKKVSIKKLLLNPKNPRVIKDSDYKKLVKSIKDFPEMLEARVIVVNNFQEYKILGGNHRYKACIDAGIEEVVVFDASHWTEEQQQEFLIKDNLNYAKFDFQLLKENFDVFKLVEWGAELPKSLFDIDSTKSTVETKKVQYNTYQIFFESENELEIFYDFLIKLKDKYPNTENVSERVLRYVADLYQENGEVSDSQRIIKMIGQGL